MKNVKTFEAYKIATIKKGKVHYFNGYKNGYTVFNNVPLFDSPDNENFKSEAEARRYLKVNGDDLFDFDFEFKQDTEKYIAKVTVTINAEFK